MLVIFSSKNVKWGQKLKLTHLYACCIMHEAPFANMKMEHQRWTEMPPILGKSGTQYVVMVTQLLSSYCGADLVDYTVKFQTSLIQIGWDIFFHHIWTKLGWGYDIITGLICIIMLKTCISMEWKEIFENSKHHFSPHTGYLFMF